VEACASGCGAERDRTAGLLHAMQALSQLSYSPMKLVTYCHICRQVRVARPNTEWCADCTRNLTADWPDDTVETKGVEPLTSAVRKQRSPN
jgi:hypothetical protein